MSETTLLNGLLGSPRFKDAAVLINELGEIPIDHMLVRNAREELAIENEILAERLACLEPVPRNHVAQGFGGSVHQPAAR